MRPRAPRSSGLGRDPGRVRSSQGRAAAHPLAVETTKPARLLHSGGRGTRTPMGLRPAVFKTAALPVRTSPPGGAAAGNRAAPCLQDIAEGVPTQQRARARALMLPTGARQTEARHLAGERASRPNPLLWSWWVALPKGPVMALMVLEGS
jgi:hypothetical protein